MLAIMEKSESEMIYKEIRRLGVFIEHTDHNVQLLAEQYDGVINRMDRMAVKLDAQGARIENLEMEMGLLSRDMKIVKADIASIKNNLEAKADVKDLTRIDRRVQVLKTKK